jgi:ribosome-associated heat shock protein Hsp15
MEKIRIDKWLWAVRIFKTRSLAKKTIDAGKVKLNKEKIKASQLVSVGDEIEVKIGYFTKTLKVLDVIEKRVGAPIAQACYEDLTPEEKKPEFLKSAFIKPVAYREKGTGRPTKKDRRDIDKFKS